MNITRVGEGKVYLIAGGGKTYTDVAAKFCRTERSVEDIIGSPQNLKLLHDIVSSNHKAAMEFDDFIFGIEGYARVTEIQLVRKRHASYMIKSGRNELHGKRSFDVVIPKSIEDFTARINLDPSDLLLFSKEENADGYHDQVWLNELVPDIDKYDILFTYNDKILLDMIEGWYTTGLELGKPEEDLRYMKPQATAFKACIKMNASALKDWWQIRMCNRAQTEIRDLATKIYKLCVEASPDLFIDCGPSCKVLGYCPEGEQCEQCKGKIPTKKEALQILNCSFKHYPYQGTRISLGKQNE